jgi:hypothetical protein
MTTIRRMSAVLVAVLASLVLASSALAHECTNYSKNDPAAGAQVLIGPTGEIVWMTEGVAERIEQGVLDPDTGEGFHGLVAFDFDGDGLADFSTWIGVGPDGEIPLEAQFNGPACRGLTNIGLYLSECLAS